MKYSTSVAAACVLMLPFCLLAQDQGAPPNVPLLPSRQSGDQPELTKMDIGPNHNVWGRVQTVTNIITHEVRSTTNIVYTQMATGLNYQDAHGQWAEASEQIEITAEGGQ